MGFSRQEYWSGLPCPPPGDFPTQGSNLCFLHCRWILYQLTYQGSPSIPIPVPMVHLYFACVYFLLIYPLLQSYLVPCIPDLWGILWCKLGWSSSSSRLLSTCFLRMVMRSAPAGGSFHSAIVVSSGQWIWADAICTARDRGLLWLLGPLSHWCFIHFFPVSQILPGFLLTFSLSMLENPFAMAFVGF